MYDGKDMSFKYVIFRSLTCRAGGEFYVPELELLLEAAHGWGVWLLSDELAHHTLAGQCTRGVRQCSAHYLSRNLSSAEQRPGPNTKRPKTRQ